MLPVNKTRATLHSLSLERVMMMRSPCGNPIRSPQISFQTIRTSVRSMRLAFFFLVRGVIDIIIYYFPKKNLSFFFFLFFLGTFFFFFFFFHFSNPSDYDKINPVRYLTCRHVFIYLSLANIHCTHFPVPPSPIPHPTSHIPYCFSSSSVF